jgi:hypothetical protein
MWNFSARSVIEASARPSCSRTPRRVASESAANEVSSRVVAKNDASYDLSRARASVTGQSTIAASTATTSLPNGRIVTRGCPALRCNGMLASAPSKHGAQSSDAQKMMVVVL